MIVSVLQPKFIINCYDNVLLQKVYHRMSEYVLFQQCITRCLTLYHCQYFITT